MAFPAAPTESGAAKIHFLTTDGNSALGWFGVDSGTTTTGSNAVGFAAIATHVHDDAAGAPGGLSTTSVPMVVVGGVRDDALGGLTPAAGDAVYLLVDANGALWTHDDALDAALDGSYLNVNANIAGTDFVGGAGAVAGGVQRVTLASNDPAVAKLGTIDTDTGNMVTALQLIDNAVDGNYLNVNANIAGTDFLGGAGAVAAGVQRVTLASDDPAVAKLGTIDTDTGNMVTALQLIDDAVYVDDADWTNSTSKHVLVGGVYESTPQTITDGDVGPLEVDSTGRLRVVVEANVSHAVTNGGTFAVQVDGNALTALQLIDDPVAVLGTATYTETTTKGMIVGAVRNDALAALAGTDNEIAPLQVDEDGGLWTHPSAAPKGGCKMFTSVDLDESEEDPAAGPVTIYGIYAWNATAAPLWLQMFNTNTVTVGTTAPTNNFLIPGNADSDGAGVVIPIPVCGLAYSTALTVAITTGSGTDNGAPGAGDAGIVILYQD